MEGILVGLLVTLLSHERIRGVAPALGAQRPQGERLLIGIEHAGEILLPGEGDPQMIPDLGPPRQQPTRLAQLAHGGVDPPECHPGETAQMPTLAPVGVTINQWVQDGDQIAHPTLGVRLQRLGEGLGQAGVDRCLGRPVERAIGGLGQTLGIERHRRHQPQGGGIGTLSAGTHTPTPRGEIQAESACLGLVEE